MGLPRAWKQSYAALDNIRHVGSWPESNETYESNHPLLHHKLRRPSTIDTSFRGFVFRQWERLKHGSQEPG